MHFMILGRSVGLELGGPVPQHNIRGARKQQGVVTKSIWRLWSKEKLTFLLESKENRVKAKTVRQKLAYVSV